MAKDKGGNNPNISEIDDDISDVCGKRIYYQLTDEEGGSDAEGRKVSARIAKTYKDGRRDAQGHLISHIFVDYNGGFNKDSYLSSGREPGTFDVFKDGDRVN